MDLARITPLLITFNERENIERTLHALAWARRIVVVDSGSTDGTLEILRRHPAVEVFQRPFDSFARQCTFGLQQVKTSHVLSLDADHVVTPELVSELAASDEAAHAGWTAGFRYCIAGKPLRASLLPPRTVLFRALSGSYEDVGHAHRVVVGGTVGRLQGALLHDDRKPLARWIQSQARYAAQEADKILSGTALDWPDRMRRAHLAPFVILPYCLLARGLLLDGWRGFFYALQRLYYEVLLSLLLCERRLSRK